MVLYVESIVNSGMRLVLFQRYVVHVHVVLLIVPHSHLIILRNFILCAWHPVNVIPIHEIVLACIHRCHIVKTNPVIGGDMSLIYFLCRHENLVLRYLLKSNQVLLICYVFMVSKRTIFSSRLPVALIMNLRRSIIF